MHVLKYKQKCGSGIDTTYMVLFGKQSSKEGRKNKTAKNVCFKGLRQFIPRA